eukprot:4467551-Pyramimonas_sp.AAC.1
MAQDGKTDQEDGVFLVKVEGGMLADEKGSRHSEPGLKGDLEADLELDGEPRRQRARGCAAIFSGHCEAIFSGPRPLKRVLVAGVVAGTFSGILDST